MIKYMKTTNFGTRLMVDNVQSYVTPLPGQTFIGKTIETIHNAKLTIDIMQYQWNFYIGQAQSKVQELNRALISQAQSGKKIRVILNKEGRGQHLMAINMKAHRYLTEAGIKVKFGRTFPINHSKLWLFDDSISILGSHNISNRSVTVNNEVSVLIKSTVVLMEFRRYFNEIWTRL